MQGVAAPVYCSLVKRSYDAMLVPYVLIVSSSESRLKMSFYRLLVIRNMNSGLKKTSLMVLDIARLL